MHAPALPCAIADGGPRSQWAESIASISKVYADGGDFVAAAGEAAGKLYGYGHCNVLFKPTKATKNPFRPTGEDAMSYFVGAEAMSNDKFKGEDAGFAINGGKGWSNVDFRTFSAARSQGLWAMVWRHEGWARHPGGR